MNYYIFVTGCQQNIYDSEKITHLLEKMGYFENNEKSADLIIAVACAVRQKPVDRIFGKLKIWKQLPKKPKIIIVGCVLPADKRKLRDKVDVFFQSNEIDSKMAKLLNGYIVKLPKSKNVYRVKNNSTIQQFNNILVPIMFGCNNFCSYCAVPYTRGREISRSEKEIINEIKSATKYSSGKIMLLGQNVNSYKNASFDAKSGSLAPLEAKLSAPIKCTSFCEKLADKNNYDFVDLLNKIENIESVKEITFMTSHPKDMSEKLINWMANSKKFYRELHLPLQSGDDEILVKMNRHYTINQYLDLTNNLKLKIKNLYLSTDIIVGFPGETKKQFENTVTLCKKIKFEKAYVSQYSPRQGTPAAKLKDDVAPTEKKRRWMILDKLINKKG